jgi:hypothetical protein
MTSVFHNSQRKTTTTSAIKCKRKKLLEKRGERETGKERGEREKEWMGNN